MLSYDQSQTPAPSISASHIFNWGVALISIGLIGLIAFEIVRLTHKPDTAFQKFVVAANLSEYNKCLKNKGGDGCKKLLVAEWRKINGN